MGKGKNKTNGNDLFEKAPVWQAFFALTIPVVLGNIVSLLYNMVDTYFVALTQDAALVAGVSLCSPIFTLTVALGDLFGLGSSSVISRLFGEKRDDEGRRVSSFGLWSAIAFGFLVAAVLLLLRTPILHLLGAEKETIRHASGYYTWIAAGAPVMIASLVPTNQLRTEGLANVCMIATIAGAVINIILDPVFIFGLGMGAAGAAVATVISNTCSLALMLYVTAKKAKKISISPRLVRIPREHILAVLAVGIPASINNLMSSIASMLLNRNLVSYGTEKVAAMGITNKIYMVILMIMISFAFGAMPLIGYSYGANNRKRLRETVRCDLAVQLAIAVVGAGVMAVFAPQLIHIFMQDASVVETGSQMLRFLLAGLPFAGIYMVIMTLFQAEGKSLPTMILTISRQGVIYALCLWALRAAFDYTGVIASQAVSDVLSVALGVILLRCAGEKKAVRG